MLTKDGARLRLVNREEEMERIIEKMTNITKDWSGRSNEELEALMNAEQQYLVRKESELRMDMFQIGESTNSSLSGDKCTILLANQWTITAILTYDQVIVRTATRST